MARSLLAFTCFLATGLLAQSPAKLDADECAVWQRELTFAQSVEKHDAKAFTAHLHAGAVFSATTPTPVRGRDAVIQAWAPLVEGKELRLRWRPDMVNIGGDRNVAISRGPYVLEDTRPGAKVRFRVGQFTSVWVKQPSGEWVVLFDGGGPPGTEVKDERAAQEHLARVSSACPAR
jgi:ketosteroid isomerase-like protein